jgi:hypothetical protein
VPYSSITIKPPKHKVRTKGRQKRSGRLLIGEELMLWKRKQLLRHEKKRRRWEEKTKEKESTSERERESAREREKGEEVEEVEESESETEEGQRRYPYPFVAVEETVGEGEEENQGNDAEGDESNLPPSVLLDDPLVDEAAEDGSSAEGPETVKSKRKREVAPVERSAGGKKKGAKENENKGKGLKKRRVAEDSEKKGGEKKDKNAGQSEKLKKKIPKKKETKTLAKKEFLLQQRKIRVEKREKVLKAVAGRGTGKKKMNADEQKK